MSERCDGERVNPPSALDLVRWVESRLDECIGFGFSAARLYGVDVVDIDELDRADGAARLTFVGSDDDASELVLNQCGAAACEFDAAVLVTVAHPTDGRGGRPRTVVLVAACGTASAMRNEANPRHVVLRHGLADAGAAGVRLAAVWQGASLIGDRWGRTR